MKKAWIVAGVKLAVGLVLLAIVLGIRVLTAPEGRIESEVAELETLQETLAQAAASADSGAVPASRVVSAGAGPVRRSGASNAPGMAATEVEGDPDRMVACQLGGGRQFMSGGDCAMRGGRATEI